MATLPEEYTGSFLEPGGERITDLLMAELQQPVDIAAITPKVAAVSPLTQQAMQRTATQAGLGTLGFDPTTGEVTGVGTGTGIAAYEPFTQAATQALGPSGYEAYMSPYQQEVLQATQQLLGEQRAAGRQSLADAAIRSKAYGGSREGVERAEYERQRDISDAALMAQLRQTGFQEAQKAATQHITNQLNVAQRQQQLESGLTKQLGATGAGAQQYSQALLEAQRQGNVLGLEYPLSRLSTATGIFSPLIAGYAGAPQPNPLMQLGTNPTTTAISSFGGLYTGNQPAAQSIGTGLASLVGGRQCQIF